MTLLRRIHTIWAVTITTAIAFANPTVNAEDHENSNLFFKRVANIPVFLNTDIENQAVAEIVAATEDGTLLAYTDSAQELIGFIDITDAANPTPAGTVPVSGEPTSVAIVGDYALAAVSLDSTFTKPQGQLEVIEISTGNLLKVIKLGGQPDSIAISPDKNWAVVVIENERDEDLGDGYPGQKGNPPGKVVVIRLKDAPKTWSGVDVNLKGYADKFPDDPEPEFVDINSQNIAAVTLQENNHIVLIDLPKKQVIGDFSAGTVNLDNVDATEDDVINQVESLTDVPREPDAITWIGDDILGTADEGDLDGGSRGFTFFNTDGDVIFSSGSFDDQLIANLGHYPEGRSENKGNEPEAIEYGRYSSGDYVFVGSERSSIISVYKVVDGLPVFSQVLVAGYRPEGVLAIPGRDLLVVASEEDEREDKFRASITIYQLGDAAPTYPTMLSLDRDNGTPIPWGAQSALAADSSDASRAWSVEDSFYKQSRIFSLDVSTIPVIIDGETRITDTHGIFAEALTNAAMAIETIDPAALLNEDGTVNIDPEGLARSEGGYFWLASEGIGNAGDTNRPIEAHNWIFKIADDGAIEGVVSLPDDTNARQRRFGLEGITSVGSGDDEVLYVCFQREWGVEDPTVGTDPAGHARIGRYIVATGEWSYYYYPLDPVESAFGGWVGLSEIVAIDAETFAVIERDNQGGADAAIKRIYKFSITGLVPTAEPAVGEIPEFPVLSKELVTDLMPHLEATGGAVIEKVEGLTVLADGTAVIVTDNDGVDDSNGETQFINVGKPF